MDPSHIQTMEAHRHNYVQAKRLLHASNFDNAIAMAKENLASNPPLDWQIMNCVLIACAEDDWKRAEDYRCAAENMWEQVESLTGATAVQLDLGELRGLLDYVAKKQTEDARKPLQSNDDAIEASSNNDIREIQPTAAPAMLTESVTSPPDETQPAPTAASERRRRGRRLGVSGKFTFRCPQRLGVWWSVEKEKFESASLNSRYRWSRVGRIMEVTGVAREGGACTECAEYGNFDYCLVDPNDAGGKCARCIYCSKDCR
ncbi:hypothetical protein PRZ48_011859 [Zasmidium cellare]|uniref:Uncharacterized protein n=1 Tax=Zasmidium cellare TaxID=395010 RepID=A0ABR0E816_ZASCE|nr:hypothetical protein PRZ48_011859 [Zasmidium cellare]